MESLLGVSTIMTFAEWVQNISRDKEYYIMKSILPIQNYNYVKPIGVDTKLKNITEQDKYDSITKSYVQFTQDYYFNREKISKGWTA